MKIGIIGGGRVGGALAKGWAKAGHEVQVASRSADISPKQAAEWADVIVLAVPWDAIGDVADAIAPASGKLVIDCTNPLQVGSEGMTLALGHTTSGAEHVQSRLPAANVVKTLNQVGAEVMADTSGFAHAPVQFVAGDDDAAKETAIGLLVDLGFEPFDAGGLSKARILEPFALTWINQALGRGKGRDWAFGAMPRKG